jgi:hypothetical protein
MKSENERVRNMTDEELLEGYYKHANSVVNSSIDNNTLRQSFMAKAHILELEHRENEKRRKDTVKTNNAMRKWTIAIGIMTAVMLIATIFNVVIASGS